VINTDHLAAQLAANIIDLRDRDADVSVMPQGAAACYGFEAQPFISEIGSKISEKNADASANNRFAVELYNPFDTDIPLGDFRLDSAGRTGRWPRLSAWPAMRWPARADSSSPIARTASSDFGVSNLMSTGRGKEDATLVPATYSAVPGSDPPTYVLKERYDIWLLRKVALTDIYLDKQQTQDAWFVWDTAKNISQSYARPDGIGISSIRILPLRAIRWATATGWPATRRITTFTLLPMRRVSSTR